MKYDSNSNDKIDQEDMMNFLDNENLGYLKSFIPEDKPQSGPSRPVSH